MDSYERLLVGSLAVLLCGLLAAALRRLFSDPAPPRCVDCGNELDGPFRRYLGMHTYDCQQCGRSRDVPS